MNKTIRQMHQADKRLNALYDENGAKRQGYKCTTPVLHQRLGLRCPCFNGGYQRLSYSTGKKLDVPVKEKKSLLPSMPPNPQTKLIVETLRNAPNPGAFKIDFSGWERMYVGKDTLSGNGDVICRRGKKIKLSLENGYTGRIADIVHNNTCLVYYITGGDGSQIEWEFVKPVTHVQFCFLGVEKTEGKADIFKVQYDGKDLTESMYFCTDNVKIINNMFLGQTPQSKTSMTGDVLIKIVDPDGIKNVNVFLRNVDENATSGRFTVSDLLYK